MDGGLHLIVTGEDGRQVMVISGEVNIEYDPGWYMSDEGIPVEEAVVFQSRGCVCGAYGKSSTCPKPDLDPSMNQRWMECPRQANPGWIEALEAEEARMIRVKLSKIVGGDFK